MRQSAGTSVKSSLSHTFLYDTRDDRIAATRGAYGKFFQELAGIGTGGNAQFYKVEMEGQVSRKVDKTGLVRLASCLASQILTSYSQCHWQQGRAFYGVLHMEEGPYSQTGSSLEGQLL